MENTYIYEATLVVLLHIATEIANKKIVTRARSPRMISPESSARLKESTDALRQSGENLQAAIAKMKAANEKLAARMIEHKAFFDKYRPQ